MNRALDHRLVVVVVVDQPRAALGGLQRRDRAGGAVLQPGLPGAVDAVAGPDRGGDLLAVLELGHAVAGLVVAPLRAARRPLFLTPDGG